VPLSGRDIKRREAVIDADDLKLIEGGTCHMGSGDQGRFVAFHSAGGSHGPLRRLLTGTTDNALHVGHKNGDPLDCRRENLVVRTIAQRCYGMRKRKHVAGQPTSSVFKGVFWESWTKKWRASICHNGKHYRLGRFGDQVEAALAYDEAARKHFGEHARLNFPDGVDAFLEAEAAKTAEARADEQPPRAAA
jgi:hypothetical protein